MKRILLFVILSISLFRVSTLYAQIDSSIKPNNKTLTKGFYKTYKEYLDNNPSIRINFSTKLYTASEEDSTIVRREYTVIDTTDMFGDFWGFCDGENVFVPNGGLLDAKYWKLQCPGPNPYFFFGHKKGIVIASGVIGIVASAIVSIGASAVLPQSYEVMFIDDLGERKKVTEYNVKQLLKPNKLLLKRFKEEIYFTIEKILNYIILYNESKLKT